jgi:type IV conjugative transfer system protein TraE
MRISVFREKWENLAKENELLRFSVLVLTLGLLVEGFLMLGSLKKTIVHVYVPEYMKKDFSIKEGKPSEEYFEQWALSLLPYITSFTPESIDFNIRTFLSYVHPRNYGIIQDKLIKLRGEIKSVGISQAFFAQQVNTTGNQVSIMGRQVRFVGKTPTSDEVVRYDFVFRVESGKPLVESINVTAGSGGNKQGESK